MNDPIIRRYSSNHRILTSSDIRQSQGLPTYPATQFWAWPEEWRPSQYLPISTVSAVTDSLQGRQGKEPLNLSVRGLRLREVSGVTELGLLTLSHWLSCTGTSWIPDIQVTLEIGPKGYKKGGSDWTSHWQWESCFSLSSLRRGHSCPGYYWGPGKTCRSKTGGDKGGPMSPLGCVGTKGKMDTSAPEVFERHCPGCYFPAPASIRRGWEWAQALTFREVLGQG